MHGSSRRLAIGITALALLAAPNAASAAIVTNGDFETGNLSGWQLADTEAGDWVTYSGTNVGGFTVPAPPQGTFAASTVQGDPSRQILFQDVTLPPAGSKVELSLMAYYVADAPIFSPDTLELVDPNEQYRIDVIRPSSPITSVASGDVLTTVFRTVAGDPEFLPPTPKTADLSAFAGQTVRLRFAVAVTEGELNAGLDAISVHALTVGKAKLNKNNGTAKLPITVTDPGTVTLSGKGVKKSTLASKSVAVQGGTVKLKIKPKGKTKMKLNDAGKAKVKLTVTYTPTGGAALSDTEKVKLKLKKRT